MSRGAVGALGSITAVVVLNPTHARVAGSMRTRQTLRGHWLGTFVLRWICFLAVLVVIAWAADVALIDAFKGNQTATVVTCDSRSGRMVYVVALSECMPAE